VRKRILQIIPTLDQAGAEKQMSLLARRLPPDEFEVHVCALSRGGPLMAGLAEAGIPVRVIGNRWRLDPRACWQLCRHVTGLRPHLIHTWMFAANAYGYAAARAAGIQRLVAGQRCVDPWKGGGQLAIDRYIARRCCRTVVNSPGVRDFYVHHGLPAEKMRVIPNGVPRAEPTGTTRRQLLCELGLPGDSRLVGLIGRLWPQKRVKDAIWAADVLKVIRDDVHLLVIGDGPHHDRLRKFREQVAIRDKVHFLGHRGDVPRLLPHVDVLWSTSGYEGQPNAVMEAMAAGVPVVATDIPGTRDLVLPERTGYLVGVGDRAGFARWTNKLLDDAELAERFGAAGRERVQREFSVEKMVRRHAELYRELLG
jgi:glycosyltransferase involved in cell wall biosynthesis